MLYDLAPYLTKFWGPFRLLQSQLILLSAGTVLAALLVLFLLPKLWHLLPHDHGKAILGKDGMKSAGKPLGKVGKGLSSITPLISQWPVVVSLPALRSMARP